MTTQALIATRKGLFRLTGISVLKPVAFAGVPVSMVLASNRHDSWHAALDHGHFGVKLHRSDDAGLNWQEITAPSYPTSGNSDIRKNGDSLELIWSMAFADHQNPQSLWAGTIPGGLFYSSDSGSTWTLNESLWDLKNKHQWMGGGYDHPGIHSICIHPQNHNRITLGVSVAGVYVSNDGGINWTNKSQGMRAEYMPVEKSFDPVGQDPHKLTQCQSSPGRLWVQHHNGIFVSENAAENWTEIEDVNPSVFGFAVAIHPQDANTAWFVPGVKDECRIPVDAKLVVTRTRDGGKSFETLNNGLPENSYDLVYRHGLDIDQTGNRLLMGSTTGNVWMSEDQGDSWQNLSNYLPPVYAVRFLK